MERRKNMRKDNKMSNERNSLKATQEMCKYCFDVIITELSSSSSSSNPQNKLQLEKVMNTILSNNNSNENSNTPIKCPLFVTWDKKRHHSEYHLRGCIGTLAPRMLVSSLGEYAKTSAFHDPRFRSITMTEVPLLRVSVSLLVNYEECVDCLDWIVGVHGIIINFNYGSREYSATFLPEVAKEQQWNQQQTIRQLVHKSGFRHDLTPEIQDTISCTRYQSSKHYLTYQEYVDLPDALSVVSP